MAPRPAKRQKRAVVEDSTDDDPPSKTRRTRGRDSVSPEKPVLPSRTRPRPKRRTQLATDDSGPPSQKSDRPSTSHAKSSRKKAIYTFFTPSVEQLRSTQGSQCVEEEELEDAIQDDVEDDVTVPTQSAFLRGQKRRQGRSADGPCMQRDSVPLRNHKDHERYKVTSKPIAPHAPQRATKDDRPWVDKYVPESLAELAVHKRKVDNVRRWLQEVFTRGSPAVLVLKGAAGTGKTSTVRLLAKEMKVEVLEWHNPVGWEFTSAEYVPVMAQFDDFVNRGRQFDCLQLFCEPTTAETESSEMSSIPPSPSGNKLLLVEEFPNTFASSHAPIHAFRDVVKRYLSSEPPPSDALQSRPAAPLILIISETLLASSSLENFTAQRLLGPELLRHPGLGVIEFNPVARTFMSKALDLALQKDAFLTGRRRAPENAILQSLGEVGDIRSALCSLEFICLPGNEQAFPAKTGPGGSKRTSTGPESVTKTAKSMQVATQREASLGMFHAVGRVVYNKRDEILESDGILQPLMQAPVHSSQHVRKSNSQVAVDDLIDRTGTDVQTFISALHENYVLSCHGPSSEESLESVNGCLDSLSDSDVLGSSPGGDAFRSQFRGHADQGGRDSLRQDEICFQVAVRGILFSLPFPVKRCLPSTNQKKGGRKMGPGHGRNDAHKMFYPTSIKLWRQREEVEDLINTWVMRFSRGLSPHLACRESTATEDCIVESWRKYSSTRLNVEHRRLAADDVISYVGLCGRQEITLERLPYLAKILRSSATQSAILTEVERVTVLNGIDLPQTETSDEDPVADGHLDPGSQPKLSEEDVRALKGLGQRPSCDMGRSSQNGKDSLLGFQPQLLTTTAKLVLSDDDIEDD